MEKSNETPIEEIRNHQYKIGLDHEWMGINTSPMKWQQEGSKKEDIFNCNGNVKQVHETIKEDIRNSLVQLFEKEVETTDSKYTVAQQYAMKPSSKI